jgi:hypothetical protein
MINPKRTESERMSGSRESPSEVIENRIFFAPTAGIDLIIINQDNKSKNDAAIRC